MAKATWYQAVGAMRPRLKGIIDNSGYSYGKLRNDPEEFWDSARLIILPGTLLDFIPAIIEAGEKLFLRKTHCSDGSTLTA
jgi:hypothetical protein